MIAVSPSVTVVGAFSYLFDFTLGVVATWLLAVAAPACIPNDPDSFGIPPRYSERPFPMSILGKP